MEHKTYSKNEYGEFAAPSQDCVDIYYFLFMKLNKAKVYWNNHWKKLLSYDSFFQWLFTFGELLH